MTRSPMGVMISARKDTPLKRCADVMDLTYGGRRKAVAPHNKHNVRAHRTGTVHAFWVVLEGGAWTAPFTVFLTEGKEAIALFSAEE